MDQCKTHIFLGGNEFLVIDLTEPLSLSTPVFPGDPILERRIFRSIHNSGSEHYIHLLSDHAFHPHGDAPNHKNLDLSGSGIETILLNQCFSNSFMVDLTQSNDATCIEGITYLKEIRVKHLMPYSDKLTNKKSLLLRTGYDLWIESGKDHYHSSIPYLSPDAAKYLATFNNLFIVGIDSPSVDSPGCVVSHQLLKDKFIIESLVHLHAIPNNQDFDLQTSPIKITGATGGPVVAYAYIPCYQGNT